MLLKNRETMCQHTIIFVSLNNYEWLVVCFSSPLLYLNDLILDNDCIYDLTTWQKLVWIGGSVSRAETLKTKYEQ